LTRGERRRRRGGNGYGRRNRGSRGRAGRRTRLGAGRRRGQGRRWTTPQVAAVGSVCGCANGGNAGPAPRLGRIELSFEGGAGKSKSFEQIPASERLRRFLGSGRRSFGVPG
jgi:hypothetical protein